VYSFEPKILEKNFWQTPKRVTLVRNDAKNYLLPEKSRIVIAV
jgi:hypothetical protein